MRQHNRGINGKVLVRLDPKFDEVSEKARWMDGWMRTGTFHLIYDIGRDCQLIGKGLVM